MAMGIGTPRITELTGLPSITIWRIKTQKSTIFASTEAKILAIPLSPLELAKDGAYVDITGSRRRIRALQRVGYTYEFLAGELGLTNEAVREIGFDPTHSHITAGCARRVVRVFDRLHLTPGPSRITERRAERKGWHPPLAWDEDTIDDPAAEPIDVRRKLHTKNGASWVEDYHELNDIGLTDRAIADRLGLDLKSMKDTLRRHRKREELAA